MKKKIIIVVFAAAMLVSGLIVMAKGSQENVKLSIKKDVGMESAKSEVPQDTTLVKFTTSEGPITMWLYNDTPLHKENFIKLVKEGYYDGVLFHRVIKDFMIQTGDPNSKDAAPGKHLGDGSPDYTIEAEILYPTHYHKYGALAAARTGDRVNPEKRSSGSQFYIVTGKKYDEPELFRFGAKGYMQKRQEMFRQLCLENEDSISKLQEEMDREGLETLRQKLISEVETAIPVPELDERLKQDYTTIGGAPHLDGDYTVFGEVIDGMDVVERIQNAETDGMNRPRQDIKVLKAEIVTGE